MSRFDKNIDRSSSDAEKYQKRVKLFGREDVYPMWVADMEFEAAPAIKDALTRRVEHGVFGYAEADDELFEIASSWLASRHAVEIDRSLLRTAPSIMTSMSAILDLLSDKGDGVTVLTPIYPPFMEVVTAQERQLHTVTLVEGKTGFEIDYTSFESALKQSKVLLFCNPHNPVGRVWTKTELEKIAALCLQHDVWVISDDAHCDIVMPSFTYHALATIHEEMRDRCVTLFGPGKGFNISGLGATLFFTHNEALLKKIDMMFRARHIVPGQLMAFQAIKAAYQSAPWLDELIPYLHQNLEYVMQKIQTEMPKIKLFLSEGTYLLWLDCKALKLSDHALKEFFVNDARLGLSQGRFFGPGGSGFMRMNCAVPREKLILAIKSMSLAYNQKY